jgi:catechol 2,3-dioxygenase-like lactoylglutathione lyase family enzyme
MIVLALHHVQLAMPAGGEDKARVFYQGILGIPEVAKPPQLLANAGVWFERESLRVHLGVEPKFTAARKAHPAFTVNDLSAVVNLLTENNYDVSLDTSIPNLKRIFTSDPFGNRIEIIEENKGE